MRKLDLMAVATPGLAVFVALFSAGPLEAETVTGRLANPFRMDPTGTTTQPVSVRASDGGLGSAQNPVVTSPTGTQTVSAVDGGVEVTPKAGSSWGTTVAPSDGGLGSQQNPAFVDSRPTASVTNSAEFCATNAAGGTEGPALPVGTKWFLLQNGGPNNCTCTFDGQIPTLGKVGVRFAGLGAGATDVADNGPGWVPATVATYTRDGGSPEAPKPPICICATAAQTTGGCFRIFSVQ